MNNLFAQVIKLDTLKALRDYMAELDPTYDKLNMYFFAATILKGKRKFFSKINAVQSSPEEVTESFVAECNTCMCLLGHLPLVKGYEALPAETWDDYSYRMLHQDNLTEEQETDFETLWEFIFDSCWPNSLSLALKRMDCVLENKPFVMDDSGVAVSEYTYAIRLAYNRLLTRGILCKDSANLESQSIG